MKLTTLRFLILAAAGVCAGLPLASQTASPLAANRIVAPVDDASRISLRGNVHPLAQARFDRGQAPGSTPTGRLTLILEPGAAQQQARTQYLADLQNPSSPSFHKWLTPAQYGAAYGISDADLQTVEGWLESHGFKIERVPQGRNLIQFSGSFDDVQNAFHTSIHTFEVNGETHFANVSDPQIPAALAPVVAGLSPLNNFHPKPAVKMGPRGHFDETTHTIQANPTTIGPDYTTGGYLYVDPADAATIYDTPNSNLNANFSGTAYDGTGVKIGIVGDSNINMADITNYRTAFLGASTSNPNTPTVVIDGNDPGATGTSDEIEALLDNEVAGGIAPGASIYFYTSANTDITGGLFNAIVRAVDDNAVSILNISFGNCEANEGSGGNELIEELMEQAAAQGISVTVSTGDSGSAMCDDDNTETAATGGFGINALASTPYTVGVGGTDYDVLINDFSTYVSSSTGTAPYYRTAKKYIPENPWNDSTNVNGNYSANVAETNGGATDIVAGGGGKSIFYTKPSFQSSVTPTDGARDLPDVSFLAGNGFYGAVWLVCADSQALGETSTASSVDCANSSGTLTGTVTGVGGTSAAAPAFAGMLALVAQAHGLAADNYRLGQADYVLYQLASSKYSTVFHDVTTGNNSVVCSSGSPDCGTNKFLTGYNAGTKYDYASGLGSVDVSALVSNWTSVTLTPTTTSLNIGGSTAAVTAAHGTALIFNVGVTPATATGAVAIIDTASETSGGTTSGPQNNGQFGITLSGGSGSTTYNGLPGGSYTVSARYGGDSTDAVSTSSPAINVTISPEASTTTLAVNAYSALTGNGISNTSIPYGAQINLDATIAGTSTEETKNGTEGAATGTVTFKNGGTTIGSGAVSAGSPGLAIPLNQASWPPISDQFAVLPAGSYGVTANYSGDPSFNASNSSAAAFTVTKDSTTTAGSGSPGSVSASGSTTVTVNITTPYNYGAAGYGSGPTGTVTLTGNGATLGTITSLSTAIQSTSPYNAVATGTATIEGSALASGANTITAAYSGDSNYAGSSGTFTVTVSGTSTSPSMALTNSGNITVAPGATTGNTSTITVTPGGGFTGGVNLSCAVATTIGTPTSPATCSLASGSVSIAGTTAAKDTLTVATTSTTSAGTYTVTVNGADAATGKVTGSTSVTVTVSSTVATPSIALTDSGNITVSSPGATTGNTSTITVTPSGSYTGTVGLSCAVTTTIANPSDAPTCSLSPASVTISGTTASTSTLTVSTTAATSGAVEKPLKRFFVPAGGAALAMVLLFGIPARRRAWRMLFSLLAVVVVISASGCGSSGGSGGGGGGGSSGTTAGAYTVTVTGTDSTNSQITTSVAVKVTVN